MSPIPLCALLSAAVPAVCCARQAEEPALPWEAQVPPAMQRIYVAPDRVIDEKPCDWRQTVGDIFRPLVKDCSSAREAVLTIASNMTAATGVYYSVERRTPFMNALEALEEKKVSCSGQSILMVCAFRSIGLPARAVMLPTWNHVEGNHTWCEVWFDGEWHMIEFNEKDFNTPWVMEGVGMLNPGLPEQHIYGVVDFQRDMFVDLTPRYMQLASAWYATQGLDAGKQRLMVDFHPRGEEAETVQLVDAEGRVIEESPLPSTKDDVRRFATLNLPRQGSFSLKLKGHTLPITPTPAPVQVLKLRPESFSGTEKKD